MERYALVRLVPDTHFHAGFGHLEEYTSGYYTYCWSEVIAKDLFTAFDPDDLFAPEVAHRYRDTVLAPGGSKDAADLVADFLGRPYDDRAFRAWLERRPGSGRQVTRPDRAGAAARRALPAGARPARLFRTDEGWLDEQWADPRTRVLVIAGSRLRPVDGRIEWVAPGEAPDGLRVLLGERDGVQHFAVVVDPDAAPGPRRSGCRCGVRCPPWPPTGWPTGRSCCTRSAWPSGCTRRGTARAAVARSSPGRPVTCCTAPTAAATSSRAPTPP